VRLKRVAGILIVITAAAAPVPGPAAQEAARRLMDSAVADYAATLRLDRRLAPALINRGSAYRSSLAANPDFRPAAQRLIALAALAGEVQGAAFLTLRPAIDTPRGRVLVQLGAYQSEAAAGAAWSKIAAAGGVAFQGLSPITEAVDVAGKGRLWRLRTAVSSRAAAQALCRSVVRLGFACVTVKP
jgi:hypothetical protein